MNLAVLIPAGKGYTYALEAQEKAVRQNLYLLDDNPEVTVYVATDAPGEIKWEGAQIIEGAFGSGSENYKIPAQLCIAQMRTALADAARKGGHDFAWWLDSDVIPAPNSLRAMRDALAFDGGFYSVSQATYPSQGGGAFLGGLGERSNPIYPDVYDDEREDERGGKLIRVLRKLENRAHRQGDREKADKFRRRVEELPPKGNLWDLQAKGYRPRGWSDSAFPGAGLGWMVKVDWVGFGNTLCDRRALAVTDFIGYTGHGTEDLHVCYDRWAAHGLNLCYLPHCPSSHAVRERGENGKQDLSKISLAYAFHEDKGPCRGHIRWQRREWMPHDKPTPK